MLLPYCHKLHSNVYWREKSSSTASNLWFTSHASHGLQIAVKGERRSEKVEAQFLILETELLWKKQIGNYSSRSEVTERKKADGVNTSSFTPFQNSSKLTVRELLKQLFSRHQRIMTAQTFERLERV